MLRRINRKEVRKQIKILWCAFDEKENFTKENAAAQLECTQKFSEATAELAIMCGILDTRPPSEWEDV